MNRKKERAWHRLIAAERRHAKAEYHNPQAGIARMGRVEKHLRCFRILKGLGREARETRNIPTPEELGMR